MIDSRQHQGRTLDRSATLATLERRLVIETDCAEVLEYVCAAYRRVRVPLPDARQEPAPVDYGQIRTNGDGSWLEFNGLPVDYPSEKPATTFRLAFYGSSKLLRMSFARNPAWHSFYAAALTLDGKAVVISAESGIGKTTLALQLMACGARFLSDEFVFIRTSDRMVSGLPRSMMIRERTLSIFPDPRLRSVCMSSTPRMPYGDRVWDTIDPGEVFGESVFGEPAPLAAAVLLERAPGHKHGERRLQGIAAIEQVASVIAAGEFAKRINSDQTPFGRLADCASILAGIPCYRVAAPSPAAAADVIARVLR